MSINTQSDISADLQIAPTDQGMVRLFVSSNLSGQSIEIPMDFTPEEAGDIASELLAAAKIAAATTPRKS